MRKKYCDQESVFAHIWNEADRDGFWTGDGASLGEEFGVSKDEAHEMLSDLADRRLIEKLFPGTYAITEWREQDASGEEELS